MLPARTSKYYKKAPINKKIETTKTRYQLTNTMSHRRNEKGVKKWLEASSC